MAKLEKNLTKTERIIRFLVGKGCTEVESSSRKYRKFKGEFTKFSKKNPDAEERFYFVGKSGACRFGKNSSTSMSISNTVAGYMKIWEEKGCPMNS